MWLLGYFSLFSSQEIRAQTSSFPLLRTPLAAYTVALGGYQVSPITGQAAFSLQNPALLLPEHAGWLSMGYVQYGAGIYMGQAIYSFPIRARHTMGLGSRHISYGTFDGYDANGTFTHRFSAQDNMFFGVYGFSRPPFSFGWSFKSAFSKVERYFSYGVSSDAGALLSLRDGLSLGLSVKDIAFFSRSYQGALQARRVRPDVWLGMSFRPKEMPFRFSVSWYRLARTNPSYYDEESPILDHQSPNVGLLSTVLSRTHLSSELFLLQDNLRLLFGFNATSHRNFSLNERRTPAGLSFGIFFSVQYFQFVLAQNHFSRSGNTHLGVTIDLHSLHKRHKNIK